MKGKNNTSKTLREKKLGPTTGQHIYCKVCDACIDTSVCEVQQVRKPHGCEGCGYFRG
ncbi:hypothetical protein A45J_0382 [hot springs metagenome]|uniref:Uncharacterized protein n=1 Tax=hot springs metagenome TaxID=433727 RepID=A0A5J4KTT0_9ZZZZ